MNRQEYILAALSTAQGASFSPVQVQKLFFLLDKNIANFTGGPYFKFVPYHYGPFDSDVYHELDRLGEVGDVDIKSSGSWRTYKLSVLGQAKADALSEDFPASAKDYIKTVSEFVRSMSFADLVSTIYKEYPEMRQRSVFRD